MDLAAPIPGRPVRNAPSVRISAAARVRRAVLWILFAGIVVAEGYYGLRLREATWSHTTALRISDDISNDWGWGQRALAHGPTRLYKDLLASPAEGADRFLEYPPLRLTILTGWAWWTNRSFPDTPNWRDDYAFNAPLLHLNTIAAAVSAAGIFLLVRSWSIRADLAPSPPTRERSWTTCIGHWLTGYEPPVAQPAPRLTFFQPDTRPRPFQGIGRAGLAASLAWFSPALLLESHAWPLFDSWLLPFFIWALLAAANERWMVAGILIGVGSMLDTAMLWVAPMFILWPLFACAPRAMARAAVGFAGAVALAASPWLVGSGLLWTLGVALVPAVLVPWRAGERPIATRWITIPIAIELIGWPAVLPANRAWPTLITLAALSIVVIAPALRLRCRWWFWETTLAVAAGLFGCPMLFGGSYDWAQVSIVPSLGVREMSLGAPNLPWILQRCFGITGHETLAAIDLPALFIECKITTFFVLVAGYFLLLALACRAMARYEERWDRRFLVAATVPWVLLYALTPDMRASQLAWAAVVSAIWAGSGAGMALLHLLIMSLAVVLIGQALIPNAAGQFPALAHAIKVSENSWGWVMLVLGAIAVWGALGPRPAARQG